MSTIAAGHSTGPAPKVRIFIVDDDPFWARSLARVLDADTRYEVVGMAASAQEALGRIPTLGPDLVLMDVRMPGLDGIEVTRRLRAQGGAPSRPRAAARPGARPSNGQPANGQPSNGQLHGAQPANGQLANGQPGSGRPANGQPSNGQHAGGPPAGGEPAGTTALAGSAGGEAGEAAAPVYPPPQVVMVTASDDDETLLRAVAAGATGYLLKDMPLGQIAARLGDALDGGAALAPRIARRLLGSLTPSAPPPREPLAPREREVLEVLASGASYAEVARQLKISSETVRTYVKAIYRKLNVSSKTEAVMSALRSGLITRPR